jgi:S1-C subfamily serine protease
VNPAIVDVTSTLPNGVAKGTGMVLTSDGEILTNDHVITGATSIHVQEVTTGKTYSASVVGYDAANDVALLKISNVSGLKTISTSSSTVSRGDNVVVIGNAYGQDGSPSVVDGTVTSTNQTITASDETGFNAETLHGLLELSANVVSGDSGGAVADTNGHVVAMTTAVTRSSASPVSISTSSDAYAIPIDHALTIVHQIESGQESSTVHIGEHGLLGVGVRDVNGGGAYVLQVQSGSAAASAGIAAGDTITKLNSTTISSSNDLDNAMASTHVGDHVTIEWQDGNGTAHHATVTLSDGVA